MTYKREVINVTSKILNLSVKAARVERGLTQDAIAQMLGITSKTYREWENGETQDKPMLMFAVAYILKIDIDLLRVPKKD
jgi:DNA-binding XRE family transcriptional regulator